MALGMALMRKHFMGMALIDMHLMNIYLMGMHLKGVHLMRFWGILGSGRFCQFTPPYDIKSLFNRTKRTHVISRTHTKMRRMRPIALISSGRPILVVIVCSVQ
jgi:hypothetical protein